MIGVANYALPGGWSTRFSLSLPRQERSPVLPLRRLSLLLPYLALLAACGGSGHGDQQALAEQEPPTPPRLEGVDAVHLVEAFPQEPIKEGEAWVRPGSVSNIVKKQQPEPPSVPTATDTTADRKAEPSNASARQSLPGSAAQGGEGMISEASRELAANPTAANEQLAAELVADPTPPRQQGQARSTAKAEPNKPARSANAQPVVGEPASPAANTSAASTTRRTTTSEAIGTTDQAARPASTAQTNAATTNKELVAPTAADKLSVATAALATRIENRQPVGVADRFAEGTRVYLFNTIINPDGNKVLVHHRWYRGEERAASVKLSVKAARWRTWSVIPVYGKGPWRVDVVAPSGRVFHTERFTVE